MTALDPDPTPEADDGAHDPPAPAIDDLDDRRPLLGSPWSQVLSGRSLQGAGLVVGALVVLLWPDPTYRVLGRLSGLALGWLTITLTADVAHEINEGGTETGKDAFRSFLARMDRCYRETVEDLVVFTSDDPTRAAAEFFIRGEYLATDEGLPEAKGQTYHLRVGAFFEIREGKIARVSNHYNLAEWMRMVGA